MAKQSSCSSSPSARTIPLKRDEQPLETKGHTKRYWSNGKERKDTPSCIKPRKKSGKNAGQVKEPPKSTKARRPPTNVAAKIPTLPPSTGPKSNTRESSLFYEYTHKVIGAAHNLGQQTKLKTFSDYKTICEAMEKRPNCLNSIKSMSPKHIQNLIDDMKNGKIVSEKTGKAYTPATIYGITSKACQMHRAMNPTYEATDKEGKSTGKGLYPSDFGVTKARAVVQNPVDFSKHPDYEANRDKIDNWVAVHYPWLAPAFKLEREFGLRADEGIGTKGDTIVKIGKDLWLSANGKPYEKTSVKAVSARYGHGSYGTATKYLKDGEQALVVEWSKGKLGRYVPILTEAQWDAVKGMREACKENASPSGRCIPTHDPDGNEYTKKQAEKAVSNAWQGAKAATGLTGKENYAYTANGARHKFVQWLIEQGYSDKEIIRFVGHIDTDKLDWYRAKYGK